MNALRIAVIAAAAVVAFPSALSAQAAEPGECIRRDPQGYCLEWDVTTPGTPGTPGGSGGGPAPECYWVTIDDELPEDPTIFVDFGLEEPPEGVPILWQSWECSDGRATFNFRWVIAPTPGALATASAGGRVVAAGRYRIDHRRPGLRHSRQLDRRRDADRVRWRALRDRHRNAATHVPTWRARRADGPVLGFRDALRARRRHARGTGEFTRRVHVDLHDPYWSQRSS